MANFENNSDTEQVLDTEKMKLISEAFAELGFTEVPQEEIKEKIANGEFAPATGQELEGLPHSDDTQLFSIDVSDGKQLRISTRMETTHEWGEKGGSFAWSVLVVQPNGTLMPDRSSEPYDPENWRAARWQHDDMALMLAGSLAGLVGNLTYTSEESKYTEEGRSKMDELKRKYVEVFSALDKKVKEL